MCPPGEAKKKTRRGRSPRGSFPLQGGFPRPVVERAHGLLKAEPRVRDCHFLHRMRVAKVDECAALQALARGHLRAGVEALPEIGGFPQRKKGFRHQLAIAAERETLVRHGRPENASGPQRMQELLVVDSDLADIFAARAGFESIAARLCAEEADEAGKRELAILFEPFGDSVAKGSEAAYLVADKAFHTGIVRISGSSRLSEVEAAFGLACRSYEHGLVRPPSETLPEHRGILAAILAGEGRAAQLGMAEHLLATRRFLLARQGCSDHSSQLFYPNPT